MFLTELIREFLFDCKVRELSDLTVHNYEKQLQKFRHFVRENFQVTLFEELKPIHVKEYISDLQDSTINESTSKIIYNPTAKIICQHAWCVQIVNIMKTGDVPYWNNN